MSSLILQEPVMPEVEIEPLPVAPQLSPVGTEPELPEGVARIPTTKDLPSQERVGTEVTTVQLTAAATS